RRRDRAPAQLRPARRHYYRAGDGVRMPRLAFPLALVLMIAAPAGGVPIALVHSGLPITQIDQQNPGPFTATNGAGGFFIFGQSFAPTLPGIDSFEFLLGGEDATVYLRILDGVSGADGLAGRVIAESLPTRVEQLGSNFFQFDFPERVSVNPG